jgi:hypothetical protein
LTVGGVVGNYALISRLSGAAPAERPTDASVPRLALSATAEPQGTVAAFVTGKLRSTEVGY